jgi:hypothetical protein
LRQQVRTADLRAKQPSPLALWPLTLHDRQTLSRHDAGNATELLDGLGHPTYYTFDAADGEVYFMAAIS